MNPGRNDQGVVPVRNWRFLTMARELNTDQAVVVADEAQAEVSLEAQIAAARAILEANGFAVRKASAVQKATVIKADPAEVAAYFASTGLNRKELADALGLTVSVIATVQNPNGDRWSQVRFELAKVGIANYLAAKAQVEAEAAAATEPKSVIEQLKEAAPKA